MADPKTLAQLPARPTVYNGIRMRSRLEAGYAAWLDGWQIEWEYEPMALASEAGQWLPDFVLKDVALVGGPFGDRTADVYVEVKPRIWLDRDTGEVHQTVTRMSKALFGSHGQVDADAILICQVSPATPQDRSTVLWVLPPSPTGYVLPPVVDSLTWVHSTLGRPALAHPLEAVSRPWDGRWWEAAS